MIWQILSFIMVIVLILAFIGESLARFIDWFDPPKKEKKKSLLKLLSQRGSL